MLNVLEGGPARPTSRTPPRCPRAASTGSSTRPSTASSAASPYGAMIAQLRVRPRRRRTSSCCRTCAGGRGDGPRAVLRRRRARSSSASRTTWTCPTSRTSSPSSRGRSTPSGNVVPRDRGRALRRPDAAALPAAPALRPGHRAGQGVQLRGGRRRQARRLPLGQRRLRLRHAPRRQLRQVPLVPQHHRPPGAAARSRTCRSTSTRRWARSRPRSRPRS